jgi:hypothetical protein
MKAAALLALYGRDVAITLDDGNTFTLAEGTEAESLKVGLKVTVTYTLKAGKMVATKIAATK